MSELINPSIPHSVDEWLSYIESLHPKSIEMGLDRVNAVATKLNLQYPFTVITVGGTNGKGSTCAMLESAYLAAGFRVGCYTSPHLIRYHERVRFNGRQISDEMLCQAFESVEVCRDDVSLTYFEMGTLAALWAFEQEPLDVVILEVGLGGRLDAVNIVDADCAIVTNVDLDHIEFLGETRELIGREKAGIYREQQISICGDPDPPDSLITYARDKQIHLYRFGIDYKIQPALENRRAEYYDQQGSLEIGTLKLFGPYQWNNAASVIFAIRSLYHKLPVSADSILHSLTATDVTGRFQYWQNQPDVILDVAHNPHAARALRSNLALLNAETSQVIAVFSMLSDKDIVSVVKVLSDVISRWEIAPIDHPRAASIQYLTDCIRTASPAAVVNQHADLPSALSAAYKKAAKNDKIIVFGSFFTVAAILELSPQEVC